MINQSGGSTLPANAATGGWGIEISLDVEWAHVIAPAANISRGSDAASSTDLYDAIDTARGYSGVSAVSMSWSNAESSSDYSDYDSYFTTPAGHNGVTFLAASGDNGAYASEGSNSKRVQFPASSPNVVGVGGTTLSTGSNGNYESESGWGNGTSSSTEGGSGGGISRYESQPTYQNGVVTQSTSYRTVPDVSLDANPSSGVPVYDTYDFGLRHLGAVWGNEFGDADVGRRDRHCRSRPRRQRPGHT